MAAASQNRFSLFSLPALVIGSMIGAGTISLPKTFAVATGPFVVVLTCRLAAGGMHTLSMQREGSR